MKAVEIKVVLAERPGEEDAEAHLRARHMILKRYLQGHPFVSDVESRWLSTEPQARRSDPDTSHEAAAKPLGRQLELVFEHVNSFPKSCTAIGNQMNPKLSGSAVARRMVELQRRGLVRVEGSVTLDNGRRSRCWVRTGAVPPSTKEGGDG